MPILRATGFQIPSNSGDRRSPPVQADLQSACMEYKDLQSGNDNGITNADTQGNGISNPVEQRGVYIY